MESLSKEHRKKGILAAFIFLLLLLLFFFLVSLKEPDPPLQEKIIEIELEIPPGGSSGGGSPTISNSNNNKSAENLVTQDDESVVLNVGNGNDKVTNQNTNSNQNNWMQMGEGGGENGGDGGDGFGTGDGTGDGIGDGPASGGARIMHGRPADCLDKTQEEGSVYLILWVNASGKIVRAENNAAKSTTGSQKLISMAKQAVMGCVTFEKRPGTPDEKIVLAKPVTFVVK